MSAYLEDYFSMASERHKLGIEPLALSEEQTSALCELLKQPPLDSKEDFLYLLKYRVNPGVDKSSKVKADFLYEIASGACVSPLIDKKAAVEILGQMRGGYNVAYLVALLDDETLASEASKALSKTLLVYSAFDEVLAKAQNGNQYAQAVIESWAQAQWFTEEPTFPECLTLKVFKVEGEINTDDFSPAPDAWSRPDIPLHATAMFKFKRPGIEPDVEGVKGPMQMIADLKAEGLPLLFAGDVVGTGSSRKSAANSLIWHIGRDIPFVPNKREGGVVLGGKIAPIFYTTLEDSGALPLECDVQKLKQGQIVDLKIYEGVLCDHASGEVLAEFAPKTPTLLDEVRAGGRIRLIIGKALTNRARKALGLAESEVFAKAQKISGQGGFTRAQKIVGRACGLEGVRPGQYCESAITTVGSQDTTGPMTRDEVIDLACLKFNAPLVMQSFCHTAAYPKSVDVKTHHTLPQFIKERGGVALKPGDGVIHSWLNRMCLPDTVGTGGD